MARPRSGWSKHRSRAEVDRILSDYESSGETIVRFAQSQGIKPETLRWWLRRRREASQSAASCPRLVPVRVSNGEGVFGGAVEVALTNGRKLRVSLHEDVDAIVRLAVALERPC